MSLQKAAMQARLSKLPRDLPPVSPTDDEEENVNEEAEASDGLGELNSIPGPTSHPSASFTSLPLPRRKSSSKVDLSPLSASTHFAQAVQVSLPDADLDVRVYITPSVPSEKEDDTGSMMVFHHGAGYSALSFAVLAKAVTESTSGECGVLAFDARAHGMSTALQT